MPLPLEPAQRGAKPLFCSSCSLWWVRAGVAAARQPGDHTFLLMLSWAWAWFGPRFSYGLTPRQPEKPGRAPDEPAALPASASPAPGRGHLPWPFDLVTTWPAGHSCPCRESSVPSIRRREPHPGALLLTCCNRWLSRWYSRRYSARAALEAVESPGRASSSPARLVVLHSAGLLGRLRRTPTTSSGMERITPALTCSPQSAARLHWIEQAPSHR